MAYPLKQSQTTQNLLFLMVDSSDHLTGKTGLSPTVTLSKNGGTFASPIGTVSEIANGWYKVAGNATDSGTLGPLALHATATGADPVDVVFMVVAFDPLRRVKTPAVLILTGANDQQAAPEQVAEQAAAVRASGNTDVTAEVVPGVNHLFVRDPDGFPLGYSKLPTPVRIEASVVGTIVDWLAVRLR